MKIIAPFIADLLAHMFTNFKTSTFTDLFKASVVIPDHRKKKIPVEKVDNFLTIFHQGSVLGPFLFILHQSWTTWFFQLHLPSSHSLQMTQQYLYRVLVIISWNYLQQLPSYTDCCHLWPWFKQNTSYGYVLGQVWCVRKHVLCKHRLIPPFLFNSKLISNTRWDE